MSLTRRSVTCRHQQWTPLQPLAVHPQPLTCQKALGGLNALTATLSPSLARRHHIPPQRARSDGGATASSINYCLTWAARMPIRAAGQSRPAVPIRLACQRLPIHAHHVLLLNRHPGIMMMHDAACSRAAGQHTAWCMLSCMLMAECRH